MIIGSRLRDIREQKKLSQGEIQKRSGLLRSYISRVENGHTVPALETMERLARALEVPLYQIFYEREMPPKPPFRSISEVAEIAWGKSGHNARFLNKLRHFLGKIKETDRRLLLYMAQRMVRPGLLDPRQDQNRAKPRLI